VNSELWLWTVSLEDRALDFVPWTVSCVPWASWIMLGTLGFVDHAGYLGLRAGYLGLRAG